MNFINSTIFYLLNAALVVSGIVLIRFSFVIEYWGGFIPSLLFSVPGVYLCGMAIWSLYELWGANRHVKAFKIAVIGFLSAAVFGLLYLLVS